MKGKFLRTALLICVMLLGGCSVRKESAPEEFDNYVFYVTLEEGVKKDNAVLYRIEYEYDENGNEISRRAYDAEGKENKDLLSYAYDQQEVLEEYWTVAPGEETVTGYWRTYKDYDFTYDARGNLITWSLYDNNDAELAKIKYTYKAVPISSNVSEKEDGKFNLEKEIEKSNGKIKIGGEIYDALYGEEGAIIWKRVDGTFDIDEHYVIAFVASEMLSEEMSLIDAEKNLYCTGWIRWYELAMVDFSIKSIGEDIFEVSTSDWGEADSVTFFNGREKKLFSLYSMEVPQIYHGDEEYKLSLVYRMNRFNDGRMILGVQYSYYKSGYGLPSKTEYL